MAQGRNTPNTDNPFNLIPFSPRDIQGMDIQGGGGKELVPVTPDLREKLAASLDNAFESASAGLKLFPRNMETLIFHLRHIGIAKSHRPTQLMVEAGLKSAGHAKIDEMLVSGNAPEITQLRKLLISRDVKSIRANISAISTISHWTREMRNPEGDSNLRERGRGVIRAFKYNDTPATIKNYRSILSLLDSLSIEYIEIHQQRSFPILYLSNIDQIKDDDLEMLMLHPGIRTFTPDPEYYSTSIEAMTVNHGDDDNAIPPPSDELPTVAIFDTGVSPSASSLSPWVIGKHTFILPPDTQQTHGTMVASLVAGSKILNNNHMWMPDVSALVYDVQGLEEGSGCSMGVLALRIEEAVATRPDIKIWNLSLGGGECHDQEFSELATLLDRLSDDHEILFIISAGNYTTLPPRKWPNPPALNDRISTPGESIRSLTVASLNHEEAKGMIGNIGEPTPYSRRGPGPVFINKPDLTHTGGGVHSPWAIGPGSVRVLKPDNSVGLTFGTSFSAPIVSAMAAHVWHALEHHPNLSPSPQLVKALLIHSAQLSSPDYSSDERRYLGSGKPDGILESLYDSNDQFSLVFTATLTPGNMRWRKSPYPMPECLLKDGKFKGEVIITATYAPPLDADFGSEYVRANVDISFGVLDGDKMKGRVPMESEIGRTGYEEKQVEYGGKWSPVKVHRKRFPKGCSGNTWALQASATLRANEPQHEQGIPAYIIVTLRSIDGDQSVHRDGVQALSNLNWIHSQLSNYVPVNV